MANLTLVAQPLDFFRMLVTEALAKQRLSVQPETEFYLVNLLNQFMTTDSLYARDGDGHAKEEPLALLLKEALETPQPEAQKTMLRHVGDVSLYTAGYFQDSLSRKLVDVDYYIDMGGAAYQRVAARTDADVFRALFSELSDKFKAFVEVLAVVSDQTQKPKTEQDILRLYEVWVQTKSERAAKALQEAGILPNESVKKDWTN